ncbi:hypothetical protein BU16DRAFT_75241 [Lophium mytilinum]|uniref:F-box domain-containing protein n=1 Tax=Lophium mytilinum TaxID=390894 RepID=A0A6A6QNE6_9PEZI|nr:hypothetical protein BU16DRAFT_75241 [Lophium mytilinum]
MATSIEKIPTELLDLITSDLSLEEFSSLRLSCKAVYASSLHSFGIAFCSKRVCILTLPSLENIVSISKHVEFGSTMRELDFAADVRPEDAVNTTQDLIMLPQEEVERRNPNASTARAKREFHEALMAQAEATGRMNEGILSEMLIEAFRNFPKLETIRFYQETVSPTSTRTFKKSSRVAYASCCFQQILTAIIESRLTLEKLKTVEKPGVYRCSRSGAVVSHDAFYVNLPRLEGLKQSFVRLRSLELWISASYHGRSRLPGWENGISQFLAAAPALESLTLHIDAIAYGSRYCIDIVRSIANTVYLPKLRKLHFVGAQFDEEDLANLVTKHKNTLCILRFECSRMHHGTWRALFETFRESLQLEALRLEFPTQGDERVTFPFSDYWCHYLSVNDQDDYDEKWTMPDLLTELIDGLKVGLERDADPDSDIAYDSDDPGASAATWERMHRVAHSDDGSLDDILDRSDDEDH